MAYQYTQTQLITSIILLAWIAGLAVSDPFCWAQESRSPQESEFLNKLFCFLFLHDMDLWVGGGRVGGWGGVGGGGGLIQPLSREDTS
jgi:hypothetical protein